MPISILPRLMISSFAVAPAARVEQPRVVRARFGSADGLMSWLPWQSTQAAAERLPPGRRACACTPVSYAATAASWQVAHCAGFSFSACGHSASAARSA